MIVYSIDNTDTLHPSVVRLHTAVRNRMFLGMHGFVQIQSNLTKYNHFCSNLASILSKFRLRFAEI